MAANPAREAALRPVISSDFIDVGDRVLVRFIRHGAGRGPGIDMEFTGVYTLHGRRIVALENICDHAATVEAVGLAG